MAPFGATTRDEDPRSLLGALFSGESPWACGPPMVMKNETQSEPRPSGSAERAAAVERSPLRAASTEPVLQRSFPWPRSGPQQGMKIHDRFPMRHFQGSAHGPAAHQW